MISICLTARPSYARIKTVLEALDGHAVFEVVAAGGALLRNYGRVVDQVREDIGCDVVELPSVYEGETLETGVLSTAAACEAYGRYFAWSQPRLVVVIADRREVLGAAIAASYQNIPLMHLLGGEHSGSIDDKVRGAITQLADYHAVAHDKAFGCVCAVKHALGNTNCNHVRVTGCPSTDLVQRGIAGPPVMMEELGGVGPRCALAPESVGVVLFHPDTNDISGTLALVRDFVKRHQSVEIVALWPGEDPGAEDIAKIYREFRERNPLMLWHFVRNLPPERFYKLLSQSRWLAGNSSVGVREARSIPGLIIKNLGKRQRGRYEGDYGHDGQCGQRVADWIMEIVSDHTTRHRSPERLASRGI